MKFCLNSRVSFKYLKLADEIKVEQRDIKSIPSLIEKFPQAKIILNLDEIEEELLTPLKKYKIILSIDEMPNDFIKDNFQFYINQPVHNLNELNELIENKSTAIKLSVPLFFHINELKNIKTQIRLTPNINWLEDGEGPCGQWIRPEDLHLYECLYDPIVEFDEIDSVLAEEALFRIYSNDKHWSGPISFIVEDLDSDACNLLMPKNIGEMRLNCKQKCQDPKGRCNFCYNALKLAAVDVNTLKNLLKGKTLNE